MKIIAVDLDGTLAQTTSDGTIGAPIQRMAARVKGWHEDGLEVVIFTARADGPIGISRVEKWLKQHGLPDLEVTNIKHPDMVEFWDNRAIRVEHDAGEPCRVCNTSRKKGRSISINHSSEIIQTDC